MIPVQYHKNISLQFTPDEIADMFCFMDAGQQANFFNAIADKSRLWEGSFESQMAAVERSIYLMEDGRNVMYTIGCFSGKTI